jgi:hypothetical protein
MRVNSERAKRFLTLSLITICIATAAVSPWIRDAWESSQQAEQSARGPEYQKGMHDSGVYWGAVPKEQHEWPPATNLDPSQKESRQ